MERQLDTTANNRLLLDTSEVQQTIGYSWILAKPRVI